MYSKIFLHQCDDSFGLHFSSTSMAARFGKISVSFTNWISNFSLKEKETGRLLATL